MGSCNPGAVDSSEISRRDALTVNRSELINLLPTEATSES
jgi:hypothetical protein